MVPKIIYFQIKLKIIWRGTMVQNKNEKINSQDGYDQNEFDDDYYDDWIVKKRNSRPRRHRPSRMNARHEHVFNKNGDDY